MISLEKAIAVIFLFAVSYVTYDFFTVSPCKKGSENHSLVTRCSDGFIVESSSKYIDSTIALCKMGTLTPFVPGSIVELDICMSNEEIQNELDRRKKFYKEVVNKLNGF